MRSLKCTEDQVQANERSICLVHWFLVCFFRITYTWCAVSWGSLPMLSKGRKHSCKFDKGAVLVAGTTPGERHWDVFLTVLENALVHREESSQEGYKILDSYITILSRLNQAYIQNTDIFVYICIFSHAYISSLYKGCSQHINFYSNGNFFGTSIQKRQRFPSKCMGKWEIVVTTCIHKLFHIA